MRLILSPQQASAGEGIGCVEDAYAAGFKVYISLQFTNSWAPRQVASYFKRVLPSYAPFAWAVGVGNEQDLTSMNRDAQGISSLSGHGRTAGENHRADWNAVEPVLVKLAPHAIRVYGEFSPWRFIANKQGFAACQRSRAGPHGAQRPRPHGARPRDRHGALRPHGARPRDRHGAAAPGGPAAAPRCRRAQGRASNTRLNGVSVARRKRLNPPSATTSPILASPACAPSASPTSCDSDAGVHRNVENP